MLSYKPNHTTGFNEFGFYLKWRKVIAEITYNEKKAKRRITYYQYKLRHCNEMKRYKFQKFRKTDFYYIAVNKSYINYLSKLYLVIILLQIDNRNAICRLRLITNKKVLNEKALKAIIENHVNKKLLASLDPKENKLYKLSNNWKIEIFLMALVVYAIDCAIALNIIIYFNAPITYPRPPSSFI